MLLILLTISCLTGQPNSCQMSSMKAFDVTNEGVRAACSAFLEKDAPDHKKALTVMYALGVNVKLANASGACSAAAEKTSPREYRKAFFENVWNQQ